MNDSAKAKLRKLNVRPSKQKGQNFVVQPYVIDEIVSFGHFSAKDHVVEVGPGMGALTKTLSKAEKLSLVELEPAFCEELKLNYPHAEVINSDVREVSFANIGSDLVVFGNLPYVFSTDIIFHLLTERESVRRAVLLLQKEFAARVACPPGSRTYGVLSIMVQVWAKPELGPIIPGDAFHPPTKVDSQVLALEFRDAPLVAKDVLDMFELVVRLAFMKRRKKLFNSLSASKHFDTTVLRESLAAAGIKEDVRAESLGIPDFERLAREIKSRVATTL